MLLWAPTLRRGREPNAYNPHKSERLSGTNKVCGCFGERVKSGGVQETGGTVSGASLKPEVALAPPGGWEVYLLDSPRSHVQTVLTEDLHPRRPEPGLDLFARFHQNQEARKHLGWSQWDAGDLTFASASVSFWTKRPRLHRSRAETKTDECVNPKPWLQSRRFRCQDSDLTAVLLRSGRRSAARRSAVPTRMTTFLNVHTYTD